MRKISNKINQSEIEQLKKNIFSDDWELVKTSADRLGELGGKDITNFLISLLSLNNPGIRNRAALALEEIRDNSAVEPLLTAIFKKENHNYNGTMVFALESLDCSEKLKEIFTILFYETYESKISAYAILDTQIFTFTKEDLLAIEQMWKDCKEHPEKCPCYDDEEMRDGIQFMVDNYLSYIKPELLKGKKLIKQSHKKNRRKNNKVETDRKK